MTTPTLGQTVHFILNAGPNKGAHRGAIVCLVAGDSVNLQVFSDGTKNYGDFAPNVFFKKGAQRDEKMFAPGTWHFPETQQ